MATVILVRHGRTQANATGLLAGRTPGVGLDETGVTAFRLAWVAYQVAEASGFMG